MNYKIRNPVNRSPEGEARRIAAVKKAGAKVSESNRNRYKSPEEREKTAQKMKEVWAKRKAGVLPMPSHLTPAEV